MHETVEIIRSLLPFGAGGMIFIVVWLILTDRLFTRPRLDESRDAERNRTADAKEEAARWREAWEVQRQRGDEQDRRGDRQAEQLAKLVDGQQGMLKVIETIRDAVLR